MHRYVFLSSALEIIKQYERGNKKKTILASDGVGESQHIKSSPMSADLTLVVVSLFYRNEQLSGFRQYKKEILESTRESSSPSVRNLMSDYQRTCTTNRGCSTNNLLNATDASEHMMAATIAYLLAFHSVQMQACSAEPGVCDNLHDPSRFYYNMHSALHAVNRTDILINNMNFSIRFDANGDIVTYENTPLYKMSYLGTTNTGNNQGDFKEVSTNLSDNKL